MIHRRFIVVTVFVSCVLTTWLNGQETPSLSDSAKRAPKNLLHFHDSAKVVTHVIRLGDLAVVSLADSRRQEYLSSLVLYSSPVTGATRQIRARQVHEELLLRNIDLDGIELRGSSRIVVTRVAQQPKPTISDPTKGAASPTNPANTPTANTPTANTPTANTPTANTPTANTPTANTPAANTPTANTPTANTPAANTPAANTPAANTPAANTPAANTPAANTPAANTLTAKIPIAKIPIAKTPIANGVVVLKRPVRRGQRVNLQDLAVVPAGGVRLRNIDPVRDVESVIGRELIRSLRDGDAIDRSWVVEPTLVRRGAIVRVGGVLIRTTAKSQQDGTMHDIIVMEWLNDRNKSLTGRLAQDFRYKFHEDDVLTLVVAPNHSSFKMAQIVADAINRFFLRVEAGDNDTFETLNSASGQIAKALDLLTIEVAIPPQDLESPVDFVATVLGIPLEIRDVGGSRVVIREKSQVIVVGRDVMIRPVAVAHKNLTIEAGGRISTDFVQVAPSRNSSDPSFALSSLVNALNALKVEPEDKIEIIKAIHAQGALIGQLIIE